MGAQKRSLETCRNIYKYLYRIYEKPTCQIAPRGRQYDILGQRLPVVFRGKRDCPEVSGQANPFHGGRAEADEGNPISLVLLYFAELRRGKISKTKMRVK